MVNVEYFMICLLIGADYLSYLFPVSDLICWYWRKFPVILWFRSLINRWWRRLIPFLFPRVELTVLWIHSLFAVKWKEQYYGIQWLETWWTQLQIELWPIRCLRATKVKRCSLLLCGFQRTCYLCSGVFRWTGSETGLWFGCILLSDLTCWLSAAGECLWVSLCLYLLFSYLFISISAVTVETAVLYIHVFTPHTWNKT